MRQSPIKPRSKKKTAQMKEAKNQLMRLIDERGNICEVGSILSQAKVRWKHCLWRAEGRHHLKKQSASGSDADDNILLACNMCNDWIEDHPRKAKELGLVIR